MENRFLELASRAFKYPAAGFAETLLQLESFCAEKMPGQAGKVSAAIKAAENFPPAELEEIYSDLFYIKPLVSLDLGYQLFGDERKRVEFLLHVKGLQQKHAVDCGTELPDSLPNVLTLLTKLEEGEDRDELVGPHRARQLGEADDVGEEEGHVVEAIGDEALAQGPDVRSELRKSALLARRQSLVARRLREDREDLLKAS